MRRACWLAVALLVAGCTVAELSDLEKGRSYACDSAHACAAGYQCVEGVCLWAPVRLTVSYQGFLPRCVRVLARDVERTGRTSSLELPGKGSATGGELSVPIGRPSDWGSTLELTAEAYEQECTGAAAVRQSRTLTLGSGVTEVLLELKGQDGDGDGFLAPASGGTDCDDTRAAVKPGAQELCNGRDDNCNRQTDEGFELGQVCPGDNGCQGAWACTASGGKECRGSPNQWYLDQDGDGRGASTGSPVDSCTQPANHVPNNSDCDDGNPNRYAGALELCNDLDEDCDGQPRNGLDVGGPCANAGCSGTRECATDGRVGCSAPAPLSLYVDGDGDGFGAKNGAPQSFCQQPDGGYAASNTDCDDTRAQVRPTATERCNEFDDDCDNATDEGFDAGVSCVPSGACMGVVACNVDAGTAFCRTLTSMTSWYPDEDLDSFGKQDAGVSACSAPDAAYLAQGNDCDDGDPFTYAGARELCDFKDNDCDGNNEDAGVCPAGGARWASSTVGAATREWYRVSLWGDGGVWISGSQDGRAVKRPGESTFTLATGACRADESWYALWADPVTGRAYVGGTLGWIAVQESNATTCNLAGLNSTDDVYGLKGFRAADGGISIHGVGAASDSSVGFSFRWDGGSASSSPTAHSILLLDVNGPSPDLLFAVGGDLAATNTEPRIYRWSPDAGQWQHQGAAVPSNGLDRLLAVSVVNPRLAYAVGLNVSVLRWDGTTWTRVTGFPEPGGVNITGVVAFGTSSVYVSTSNGKVYLLNAQTWRLVGNPGGALRDIAGTSPEDLYVVGDGGRVLHWPQ